jgi:2-iminobutanoate/2-iminopropanoate deaminase
MRNAVRLPRADAWIARGQEPLSAARVGDLVFTAGIPAIDLATGELPAEPERQFALAFENLVRLLDQAGVSPDEIGLVTVYIPDSSYRKYINGPWLALYPGPNRPARKTNQLPLPEGMVIQVQANAVAGAPRPVADGGEARPDGVLVGDRWAEPGHW